MSRVRTIQRLLVPLAAALAAVALATGFAAFAALLAGTDPAKAAEALVKGSIGGPAALADTLLAFVPLLLTGVAVALAFRSGVFNIGAEGQFLVGALAATAAGVLLPAFSGQALVVLLAGAVAGALWAAIAGVYRLARGINEVITTILLNFIALYLVSWAVHGPLQEAARAYPQSDALPAEARLWPLWPGSAVHVGLLIALVLLVVTGAVLSRTSLGLRWRSAGQNASAARLAGFPVGRDLLCAFASSGALAGLAGAIEVAGLTGRLYERIGSGYGFTAIAIALLGGLNTAGVGLAAWFFAALATGAQAMERVAGVPSVLAMAAQGATLLVIAVVGGLRLFKPDSEPSA